MTNSFDSRRRVVSVASVLALAAATLTTTLAQAADPLTVGVLLPGSRSDKGWMESAYDGLMAAEKEHGDKIKVQLIENVSNADWEQAFTALAQKNQLVIGAAGQVQTAEMKIAKKFPKVKFSLIGRTSQATTSSKPRSPTLPVWRRACCRRTEPSAISAASRSRRS
jgi:basic membrane protein A